MPESDDHRLPAEFVRDRSEPAFTKLVSRYAGLVHSTAFRFCGNPHSAEEITQSVFIILARKAGTLSPRVVVSGWLYQTTRLTAANFVKGEMRRRRREQEAVMQSNLLETDSTAWKKIAPLLDDAMGALGETDRNAVLLRYFENRTSSEIGVALRMNEETARKRVNRALEKLRHFFVERGVTVSGAALSGAISANSVQPISAFTVKSISAAALVKDAAASTSTLTLIKGALKIMAWTKAKTAVAAGVAVLLAVGTTTVVVKTIHPGEPSYGGKTLTAWLEASKNLVFIDASDTQADRRRKEAERQKTYDAVQHIGPSAIPILLKWVANTTNGGGNILAAGCIQKLGPEAKGAVPGLMAILGSDNEMERYSSFNVLQRIGSAADQALPAILDHIQHDPLESMRSFAVTTLANNGIGKQNPDAVIPVLIECLAPTNKAILRPETLRALAGLGASAKSAVPAILPYLKDPDPELRTAARNALLQIDPAAAGKM